MIKTEFIRRAKKVQTEEHDYSEVPEHVNLSTNVWITFACGHRVQQRVGSHIGEKAYGCNMCKSIGHKATMLEKGRTSFIKKSIALWGNHTRYTDMEYNGYNVDTTFYCTEKHQSYVQRPAVHMRRGCKLCKSEAKKKQQAKHKEFHLQQFLDNSTKRHAPGLYAYPNSIYDTSRGKIEVQCLRCNNPFWVRPYDHSVLGTGCPDCPDINVEHRSDNFLTKAMMMPNAVNCGFDEVDYQGNEVDVKIYCKIHKEFFYIKPRAFLRGGGCKLCTTDRRKLTGRRVALDEHAKLFVKKAIALWGTLYDYSLMVYKGAHTYIKIRCTRCGEVFEVKPYRHLDKTANGGCRICRHIDLLISQEDMWRERWFLRHGTAFGYSRVLYENRKKEVEIYCKKCKCWYWQTPENHEKYGHFKCSREKRAENMTKTNDDYLTRLKARFVGMLLYHKVDYKGMHLPVTVICTKCNEETTINAGGLLRRKYPCKCYYVDSIRKRLAKSNEDFKTQVNELNKRTNESYEKDEGYINLDSVIMMTCAIHGEFSIVAKRALNRIGNCPSCEFLRTNGPDQECTLYYLKVVTPEKVLYKVGITIKPIDKRYSKIERKYPTTMLFSHRFANGGQAIKREREILRRHASGLYKGDIRPFKHTHNSEVFEDDVLGLDIDDDMTKEALIDLIINRFYAIYGDIYEYVRKTIGVREMVDPDTREIILGVVPSSKIIFKCTKCNKISKVTYRDHHDNDYGCPCQNIKPQEEK